MSDHNRAHEQLQFDFATTRTCTKCGETKPLDDFARAKLGKYGRYSQCKECKRAIKRVWHSLHRESQNAKARAYQEENRTVLRTKSRAKYREEREKMVNVARQRYWDDPEKPRQLSRANAKKNPEKPRAHVAVAKAVKKGKLPPVWTMVCEDCQEAQAQHWHHHHGYERKSQLDVVALCTICHGKAHWVDFGESHWTPRH